MNRVLLAYSGSAATSAAIGWLIQQGYEVVTVTLDLGQGGDLAGLRERALSLGAVRAHVLDVRDELVRDFGLTALQAGILADPDRAISLALGRALLASRLVDLARMEGAAAVAHAADPATGGVDILGAAIASLNPSLEVIATRTAWDLPPDAPFSRSRQGAAAASFRANANLLGRVVVTDGDALVEDAFLLTRNPDAAPPSAAVVQIDFVNGVPTRTNQVEMSLPEMLESLDTIAGVHGVGRSLLADGTAAIETPAATVLQLAHATLAQQVLGADLFALKTDLARLHAAALVNGNWFSDSRRAVDAFNGVLQRRVTGSVTVQLSRGQCVVTACVPTVPAPAAEALA